MGLLLSKEDARMKELKILIPEAWKQYWDLAAAAAPEQAAGLPAAPVTLQALCTAVFKQVMQLLDEQIAISARQSE